MLNDTNSIFETPLSAFSLTEIFRFFPEDLSSRAANRGSFYSEISIPIKSDFKENKIQNYSRLDDLQNDLIHRFHQNPFLYFEDTL